MGLDGEPPILPPKAERLRLKCLTCLDFINAKVLNMKFGFVQQHRPSPGFASIAS